MRKLLNPNSLPLMESPDPYDEDAGTHGEYGMFWNKLSLFFLKNSKWLVGLAGLAAILWFMQQAGFIRP